MPPTPAFGLCVPSTVVAHPHGAALHSMPQGALFYKWAWDAAAGLRIFHLEA